MLLDPKATALYEQIASYRPSNEQEEADRAHMMTYLETFPDLLTRTNPLCHFTASGWIVNPSRTKVLMIYHNIYNSWSWVGGHADGEADLCAVALKETCEETGVHTLHAVDPEILSLEILPVPAHVKRGKFVSAHLHLNLTYLIEADDNDALFIRPDENSGVQWMSPDEAVTKSTEPDMQVIYKKLNEKVFPAF